MTYSERKTTPLKWHRFVQIIVLPLTILVSGYISVSMAAELLGFPLGTPKFLTPLLTKLGIDIFSLGSLFWPVTAVFCTVVLVFLLSICAWTGFFSWRPYSRFCWEFLTLIMLAVSGLLFYVINVYGISSGIFAYYLEIFFGIRSISARLINVIRVLLVILFCLQIIFTILNVVYYFRRRRLFRAPEYEDEDEEYGEDAPLPAPEVKVPEEGTWTCPRCGAVNTARFCNNCGERRDSVKEGTAGETRANFLTLSADEALKEPAEAVSIEEAPVSEAEPVQPEETLPVMTEEPEEAETEAEEPVLREMPASLPDTEEENGIEDDLPDNADDIVSDILQKEKQELPAHGLLFCPGCGAKLSSDADIFFCSHCGAKLIERQ